MCKWTEIRIEPRDVLFFRGGKPMGGSTLGEGARIPLPSVFHQAMLSAFHARWPDAQTRHQHIRDGENKNSSFLYGDLQTVGVFPTLGKTVYFPMPADVQCEDKEGETLCMLQPAPLSGKSDLPAPLKMALFKPGEASKEKPGQWISEAALINYLKGSVEKEKEPELFDVESRPGIGVDAQTGAADIGGEDEGGKFYLAEYLRLRDGVSLKGFATGDAAQRYFSEGRKQSEFIFGGQRGVAYLEGIRDDHTKLPTLGNPSGTRIKWVLLTPAIFTGGWLPSWIDAETGSITGVKTSKPERAPRESRTAWRARFEQSAIPGKLVAACIPKPIPVSGWKATRGTEGPRPTRLCVPAGAVYYFETDNEEQTKQLLDFLNGKRKSDIAAEKGFGFGVCGTWKSIEAKSNQGENQ